MINLHYHHTSLKYVKKMCASRREKINEPSYNTKFYLYLQKFISNPEEPKNFRKMLSQFIRATKDVNLLLSRDEILDMMCKYIITIIPDIKVHVDVHKIDS